MLSIQALHRRGGKDWVFLFFVNFHDYTQHSLQNCVQFIMWSTGVIIFKENLHFEFLSIS